MSAFLNLVSEVIRENGWERELIAEELPESERPTGGPSGETYVRVRKTDGEVVDVYPESTTFIEQVQQECFRFLRTGRTGR